ncbi:hypothetical protein GW916_11335 [bacterium]|nr:hypothetical protein [bacterium]
MKKIIMLSSFLIATVSFERSSATPCELNLESSFSHLTGTRTDQFVHLSIDDLVWAKTILPPSAFEKQKPGEFKHLTISRGNSPFPDMRYGDDYVKYFDNMDEDIESVEGSRESDRILVNLASGVSFEFRFKTESRRSVELWVHGLTGPVSSKKIFTARSGLELFL